MRTIPCTEAACPISREGPMRTKLIAAIVMAGAVTWLASIASLHAAEAAPKPPDRVTVGATSQPDRQLVERAPMLMRAPSASAKSATLAPAAKPEVTLAPVAKVEPFGTAMPLDAASLSAAQRQKLAAGPARAPVAPRIAGVKPENLSTIVPPAFGSRPLSIETPMDKKLPSPAIATPSAGRTSA